MGLVLFWAKMVVLSFCSGYAERKKSLGWVGLVGWAFCILWCLRATGGVGSLDVAFLEEEVWKAVDSVLLDGFGVSRGLLNF